MKIWSRIKSLSISQIFRVGVLFIRYPLYVMPTLSATKETLNICDKLFGKAHHKNGKENAFRHALWNIEICKKTFKIAKNEQKSVEWAQKITNLHEKLAPNRKLERAMDLHNNEIGRQHFLVVNDEKRDKIVEYVQKLTEKAQFITKFDDISKHRDNLVYIEE